MAKKKAERTKLTERADREMSRYIRLFHSDENGTCECVSCGALMFWKGEGMQMGHFANKGKGATAVRWLHHNAYPQDFACNCSGGSLFNGNNSQVALIKYTIFMQNTFGQSIVDDLLQRKFKTIKYVEDEIREIGDLYKEFADKLLEEKGL